ncbi:MAG: hypothetical protein GF405_02545, partial [Candidatus Eisenbacteria bacterium]|nr:hypothetical protein [Candidatus Eisenbacteria bacterium]
MLRYENRHVVRCLAPFALALLVLSGGCGGEETPDAELSGDDLAMWEDPGGRWHMQVDREMTEEQKEEVRRLRSIGYLAGQAAVPEV